MKQPIKTSRAPQPIGPFAQAVAVDGFLFISGQLPFEPETKEQYVGTLRRQTDRVLRSLRAIVEEAGATLDDVVRLTVYVSDLEHLEEINHTLARFFPNNPPACTYLQVARLYRDAGVQVDAIVRLKRET
jgi:2-iminobutanoate/2-iminopropanoate deaminase